LGGGGRHELTEECLFCLGTSAGTGDSGEKSSLIRRWFSREIKGR
jgi:hypothetical protein